MKMAVQWFAKHTQQAVMARTSVLPVIARTGPSNRKSSSPTKTKKNGEGVFIVGQSEVGGDHRVGGTP